MKRVFPLAALAFLLFGCISGGPGQNEAVLPQDDDSAMNETHPQFFLGETRIIRGIGYSNPEGNPLLLDLYVPQTQYPVPLIINVHGGGWLTGDRSFENYPVFIERGFAVASIDYRLSDEAKAPAQIEDVKAAIRFLRLNAREYGLDPDRFGIMGPSAGGHLAALAGTSGDEFPGEPENASSRVQAVVDMYGPTNFSAIIGMTKTPGWMEGVDWSATGLDLSDQESERYMTNEEMAATFLIGGPLESNTAIVEMMDPIAYVDGNDPPFLIIHGTADSVVPMEQSRDLHEALQSAGVDSTLVLIEGGGHGAGSQGGEIMDFFEKHLG